MKHHEQYNAVATWVTWAGVAALAGACATQQGGAAASGPDAVADAGTLGDAAAQETAPVAQDTTAAAQETPASTDAVQVGDAGVEAGTGGDAAATADTAAPVDTASPPQDTGVAPPDMKPAPDAAVPPDSTTAPDATTPPDGTAAADLSATVQCTGVNPTFPQFAKTCKADTDCVIGLHQTNCCGTMTAIGLAYSEWPSFSKAESECETQYPGCDCASMPTTAEDGKNQMDGAITVSCQVGACTTAVVPVACTADPPKFPTFPKACFANDDCASVLRQVDCCGTKAAIGVAKSAQSLFEQAAAVCDSQYPKCKCMAQPTKAEDGQNAQAGAIVATCTKGLCLTGVAAP